jgi:nitrogen fixation protein FixH
MNMFVSIFGGILLTAILFGLLRSFRLSNFWAAVLAAALPSFAYMIYSVVSWPGLDVLTMHVVAFPTVALLLYQIGGSKDGPYEGIHWAPKLMIGFFVTLTIILGGFVYIAGNGVPPSVAQWLLPNAQGKNIHTGFAGVVAHGEEASKSIAHYRSMDSKLSKLGWNVEVSGLDDLQTGVPGEVRVKLGDASQAGVADADVSMALGRPGKPADKVFELTARGGGDYVAQVLLPDVGEWLAVLKLAYAGEQIVLERELHAN